MNLHLEHQIFAWNKYKQIKWTNFFFFLTIYSDVCIRINKKIIVFSSIPIFFTHINPKRKKINNSMNVVNLFIIFSKLILLDWIFLFLLWKQKVKNNNIRNTTWSFFVCFKFYSIPSCCAVACVYENKATIFECFIVIYSNSAMNFFFFISSKSLTLSNEMLCSQKKKWYCSLIAMSLGSHIHFRFFL